MKINKWPWLVAAFCLTLAGPMVGAISTLTWSYAADGNDPQRIAAETYRRVMRFGYGPTHDDYRERRRLYVDRNPITPNRACVGRIRTNYQMRTSSEVAAVEIQRALDFHRIDRLRDEFDAPATDALASLPAPILGALASCIEQSVLGGLCARRVVTIADDANREAVDTLRRQHIAINRAFEAMWCAIGPR